MKLSSTHKNGWTAVYISTKSSIMRSPLLCNVDSFPEELHNTVCEILRCSKLQVYHFSISSVSPALLHWLACSQLWRKIACQITFLFIEQIPVTNNSFETEKVFSFDSSDLIALIFPQASSIATDKDISERLASSFNIRNPPPVKRKRQEDCDSGNTFMHNAHFLVKINTKGFRQHW